MARKKIRQVLETRLEKEECEEWEKAIYLSCKRTGDEYGKVAYEYLGEILPADAEELPLILLEIENDIRGWHRRCFLEQQEKFLSRINTHFVSVEKVVGLYVCKEIIRGTKKKCGSNEFMVWTMQTRGGDEGATHYRQCILCGARKRES